MIKKYLIFLDCLLIFSFLFNMGALAFTNIMVSQKADVAGQELVVREANLVAAKIKNLEPVPQKDINRIYRMFIGLFFHFIVLAFAYSYYIYLRFAVITRKDLFYLSLFVFLLTIMTATDFFNNLGVYIGQRLFF